MAEKNSSMSAIEWFFRRPTPKPAGEMESLQAAAKAGDVHAVARFKAAKWNETVPLGSECLYLKSELEGKVIANTNRAAWASGEHAFVELEHIGMVLLDKVERFFG